MFRALQSAHDDIKKSEASQNNSTQDTLNLKLLDSFIELKHSKSMRLFKNTLQKDPEILFFLNPKMLDALVQNDELNNINKALFIGLVNHKNPFQTPFRETAITLTNKQLNNKIEELKHIARKNDKNKKSEIILKISNPHYS